MIWLKVIIFLFFLWWLFRLPFWIAEWLEWDHGRLDESYKPVIYMAVAFIVCVIWLQLT